MKRAAIIWLFLLTVISEILGQEDYSTCCHSGPVCSCASHINFYGETHGNVDINSSDCLVYKIRNVSECDSFKFDGNMNERRLGSVRLHPVVINFSSNLNMSFINVKWTKLQFRLSGMERSWSLCRTIELSKRAAKWFNIKELFYSCRLLSPNMTDQNIMLEYHASRGTQDEFGRFTFRLDSPIDRLRFTPKWKNKFVYIEWQLPLLIAHWHHPFSEEPAKYEVVVRRDGKIKQNEKFFSDNGSNIADLGMEMKYDTMHFPGYYIFEVTKECAPLQDCDDPSTATVKIAPVSRLLQYISLSILFLQSVLVLIILWMTAQWYRAFSGKPNVLVMYSPSRGAHVKAVRELVNFLREHCRMNVLFDLDDIKVSPDPDPVRWYTTSLGIADYVLMVASPPPPGIPDKFGCLHPALNLEHGAGESLVDPDLLSMQLLAPCLARRRPRVVVCLPPGTTVQHLPPEIRTFRTYCLPAKLEPMLRALRGVGTVLPCLPPPPGAERNKAEARTRVSAAMKAAERDLRERPPAPGSLSPWERPCPEHSNLSKLEIPVKQKSPLQMEISLEKSTGELLGQRQIVTNKVFPGCIDELNLLKSDDEEKEPDEQQEVQEEDMQDLLHDFIL
ncbi:uncharacterized protein LOC126334932 isoform X2 [Schistocerca gregaria]|uniref:uncharacterized protein LOC126334932 isoform X2 n=1 Tax=Schistocerca gregaria TaxID=7010 RepID=UPI00211E3E5F|nr:uncharacterized protein LOC126334932 isoform X2 [Schistocerca gregaria]